MADTDDLYILHKEIHSLWSSLCMKVTQHVYVDPDDSIPTKLVGDTQDTEISYANMDMVSCIPQVQLFTIIPIFISADISSPIVIKKIKNLKKKKGSQWKVRKQK